MILCMKNRNLVWISVSGFSSRGNSNLCANFQNPKLLKMDLLSVTVRQYLNFFLSQSGLLGKKKHNSWTL